MGMPFIVEKIAGIEKEEKKYYEKLARCPYQIVEEWGYNGHNEHLQSDLQHKHSRSLHEKRSI